MGATKQDVAHNWAHQLKPHLTSGNFSFRGSKIYSYSTVIGQVLDCENGNRLYLLNDNTYSSSTTNHQSSMIGAIPNDAHIFPLEPKSEGFHFGWSGVSYYGDGTDFPLSAQMRWVFKFSQALIAELTPFKTSRALKTEDECRVYKYFNLLVEFCKLTGCTTIKKLIALPVMKWAAFVKKEEITLIRKVLKACLQKAKLSELVDVVCGENAYKDWVARTSGPRKSRYVAQINHYLGFNGSGPTWRPFYEPYPDVRINGRYVSRLPRHKCVYGQNNLYPSLAGGITWKCVESHRKAGDYLRFLIKTRSENFRIAWHHKEIEDLANRKRNAMRKLELYLGICVRSRHDVQYPSTYSYGSQTIDLSILGHYGNSYMPHISKTDYDAFTMMSKDEQKVWLDGKRKWVFEEYSRIVAELTEESERIKQHQRELNEKWARELARKEELRKELLSKGPDGVRKAYHDGLITHTSLSSSDFYPGSNVLMRFNKDANIVETSKGMKVAVEECKRLWELIKRWHANRFTFQYGESAKTYGYHPWAISSYSNDILTVGCHSIAYQEMEDLAKTLGFAI